MFKKILIANRGEIAIRVMRSCREMGIATVAVYSDCDRLALHVTYADESYHIGPPPSKDSYLAADKIIDAAKKSGAEAIHPGYGFLAENADFAAACETAGLAFIGPPATSIRQMGNKLDARRTMSASGVTVIPGSEGPVASAPEAAGIAREVGLPVMIKAVAGGGGKGLRVVRDAADIDKAVDMTMGEAESAFADGRIYVEKYIENPKHVEIQVLADKHGSTLTLGERECSMQRRYQKVIEEAPSPSVTAETRAALSQAAKKAAQAVGYVGAGTVEFIMAQDGSFYFLEMNTRLQVEHPVTEVVYGVDLVKEQIRIAAGLKLELEQESIRLRGHALEVRIYAEDPHANFMPSTGVIKRLVLPEGPGVRNENGIYPGYTIPIYYDPLIGKVIIWAEDRGTAIRRTRRALQEYQIDGVTTNIEFLLWAISQPGFLDGTYDTHYIERHFKPELLHSDTGELDLAMIAASIAAYGRLNRTNVSRAEEARDNVWRRVARMEGLRKPRL
ncbi:MAG: acetyl-CoA carboxylase biotin carboxylase subunit [Candidatus Krumholzibacteria bacterium]|nr:acetyl-CoA carboxylase biotin carboxylase subunit [Candidatus Krumholzibacteria bacterium]